MACDRLQPEGHVGQIHAGDQFQQGFVDAAEFLCPEVAVVDGLGPSARDLHPGKGTYRGQEGVVAEIGAKEEVGFGLVLNGGSPWVGVEQATKSRHAELRKPLTAKSCENQALGLPQVGVGSAGSDAGYPAESGCGEVVGVAVLGLW